MVKNERFYNVMGEFRKSLWSTYKKGRIKGRPRKKGRSLVFGIYCVKNINSCNFHSVTIGNIIRVPAT